MGLLDSIQAASNAAASNVSGPIDGIAWLLRKAGINVPEPVGGSEWMARQGLTRQVQPGAAQVIGATAGLLGPSVVAAKAPQIARGLLQAAENAAAPKAAGAMQAQRGALYVGKDKMYNKAYHGAGEDFPRFSPDYVGSANADLGEAYWLTNDWGHARGYSVAANPGRKTNPLVKEANVYIKNPKTIDAMEEARSIARQSDLPEPSSWDEAAELLQYADWLKDEISAAKKAGHDAVIVKNTGDAPGTAGGLADHFAIFDPRRVRFYGK